MSIVHLQGYEGFDFRGLHLQGPSHRYFYFYWGLSVWRYLNCFVLQLSPRYIFLNHTFIILFIQNVKLRVLNLVFLFFWGGCVFGGI